MLDNSGGKYDTWWGAGSGGVAEVTTVLMTTCKGGMRCGDWSCGVANIPIPIQDIPHHRQSALYCKLRQLTTTALLPFIRQE